MVPAGTYYLQGPIHFESNTCLELSEGAILRFSPDSQFYLPMVKTSWEGTFLQNYSPFIYGYGLHDISIIGKGTIDGNASTTFATWRKQQKPAQQLSRNMNHKETPVPERNFGEGSWLRPQLIQFSDVPTLRLPTSLSPILRSGVFICSRVRTSYADRCVMMPSL